MSSDTTSITEFLENFSRCWGTDGGKTLGDFFTEDGSLVNPFGGRADGRQAVGAMYDDYFESILRATTTSVKLDTVRRIGDYAFIDGEQTILGPTGEVALAVHLCALLHRATDGWRFVDSRPYSVATQ